MKSVSTENKNVINLIIGAGELEEELKKEIDKKGLIDTSFLLGSIPEAARFLKAGDLFVLPSKSESYGYVLHEAGLASVPVLATNVGGIPDVVKNNETGVLVPADNTDSLANAIKDFIKNKEAWNQRAAKHHEEMASRSINSMTEATTTLYTLPLN